MKAVYSFSEGSGKDRRLLGGKGAGLCEMTRMRLPVPPGFVITTEVCKAYYRSGGSLPRGLMAEVRRHVARLERRTGKTWGRGDDPLLVSVRSGAAVSMPGMMDTILNLGVGDATVGGLASAGGERFAWDTYRRFVQLFGKVVMGVPDSEFDAVLDGAKAAQGVSSDSALSAESLRGVVARYKAACEARSGRPFPSDPDEQLEMAVRAVFASWMGERAVVYRERNGVGPEVADGTAVNVVAMAFGNMGEDSATGVVFTRDPADGARRLFGEYLVNAQGEDVVAGTRTPEPIDGMRRRMPGPYRKLAETCRRLERHYREPQDIEFTVERGRFYLLQTRAAKMNAAGAVRASVDMVRERLIPVRRALERLDPEQLEQLLHETIDRREAGSREALATGIAASPGAAAGVAVFDVSRAAAMGDNGASVILVREETKPEDVPAFFASAGILTSRGGKTSHAAVVARGMGKPCIVGASEVRIDYAARRLTVGGRAVSEGDPITIDGSSGAVYSGHVPTSKPEMTREFRTVLRWAAAAKGIGVRANADTPEAAELARSYGAEGIGLCRTERMFSAGDRMRLFVGMIMAAGGAERAAALRRLGELQRGDFERILSAMRGRPVTIRLLDPPLHEFLPGLEELAGRARAGEEGAAAMLERARELSEVNPMMGHRGVRVGVTHPEIYEMQIRAVFAAHARLAARGVDSRPQVMVPQVGSAAELRHVRAIYDRARAEAEKAAGRRLRVGFGTMIEVVRAALTAGELAAEAEFFSFGTNDLTQATFSFSREDAEGKFLPEYLRRGLLGSSPFQSIDADGVGELMRIGIGAGRAASPGLEVGVCGEHGGDPRSIGFCHGAGVSYVSASPHRIPIAMVAAAQASARARAAGSRRPRPARRRAPMPARRRRSGSPPAAPAGTP